MSHLELAELPSIERILAMLPDEWITVPTGTNEDIFVHRMKTASRWIVRLGEGGVSLARSPERALFYVRDRLRLARK